MLISYIHNASLPSGTPIKKFLTFDKKDNSTVGIFSKPSECYFPICVLFLQNKNQIFLFNQIEYLINRRFSRSSETVNLNWATGGVRLCFRELWAHPIPHSLFTQMRGKCHSDCWDCFLRWNITCRLYYWARYYSSIQIKNIASTTRNTSKALTLSSSKQKT